MPTAYLIKRTLYPPQITIAPTANLGIVVVIPCFHEPDLMRSLEALRQAKNPTCAVEIIVVINDAVDTGRSIKQQHEQLFKEAQIWADKHRRLQKQFHIIYQSDLPAKKAGVGLARKIGMDEAALRLEAVNNPKGIIVGFDADSLCEANYFQAIENHFKKYEKVQACSIWYEHPLAGINYDEKIYQAITQYELHLRYFTLAKRFAGYPNAFETIGSSMAVRADAYQQQGGMNTRKAGEDFYFLNKFIVLGKLNELNETKVIPSPRISDRVPFGTGKMVGDLLKSEASLTTYSYQSFIDLKKFIAIVPIMYENVDVDWTQIPEAVLQFLNTVNAKARLQEIKDNTTDYVSFEKRFFRWFDPFMIMKYAHFTRDHFYENIPVKEAGGWILEHYFGISNSFEEEQRLLLEIRALWLGEFKNLFKNY